MCMSLVKNTMEKKYVAKLCNNSASAYSVAVYKGQVYVAGDEFIGNIRVATIWKDGVAQRLADKTSSYASCIHVCEQGVFVAGGQTNGNKMLAKLWKDGMPHILTDGANDGYANAVALSGGEVLVVGYEDRENSNGSETEVAKLWTNGVAKNLPGTANSIFIVKSEI